MKKILLSHVSNTLNYGSAMMAINLIAGLCKEIPELEIWCECNEFHLARLKEATGCEHLHSYLYEPVKQYNAVRKIYGHLSGNREEIARITSRFDVLVALGGDDMSEVYQANAFFKALFYYHINRKGCKVILLGQNIGPYSGMYRLCIGLLLRKLIITTRDRRNFEYLTARLHLHNVTETRDLAFLPLPFQERFTRNMSTRIPEGKCVVLVPSGVFFHYDLSKELAVEIWKKIAQWLLVQCPGCKVIVLAHVLAPPTSDDRQIIAPMSDFFAGNDRVIVIEDELQPAEARAIIQHGELVLSGRMHAAVSALATGRVPIAFAYSEKYFGVIQSGFDMPELVIDCRKGKMVDGGFWDTLKEHIAVIIENKASFEKKIIDTLDRTRAMSVKNIEIVLTQMTD